jgi:hypothetical protein
MQVNLKILNIGNDISNDLNLTADVGSVSPTSVTKTQLQSLLGIDVTVDDLATSITATSTGTCTNSLVISITGIPTTTTTTTTTSTTTTTTTPPVTFYEYNITNNSYIDSSGACGGIGIDPTSLVYANTDNPTSVTSFYTDQTLINKFTGDNINTYYGYRINTGPNALNQYYAIMNLFTNDLSNNTQC